MYGDQEWDRERERVQQRRNRNYYHEQSRDSRQLVTTWLEEDIVGICYQATASEDLEGCVLKYSDL
jgi:hypothetical protein